MKNIQIITLFFFLLLVSSTTALAASTNEQTIKGEILDVLVEQTDTFPEYQLKIRILEGQYTNQIIETTFMQVQYSQWDFVPKIGQTLVLHVSLIGNDINVNIIGLSRQNNLIFLFLIFLALLLVFGRTKGLLSLISLILTGIIIYIFFIPLVLKGYNIMFLTIFTAIAIIIISFIIISGFSKKSLISILGTVFGIISAVVLSEIFCKICVITGAVSEEAFLLVSENGINIDFAELFISGIIIGTIGVVMDVSMSITSFAFELKENSPKISFSKLVSSCLNVGKDMMATMINTLILAYVGTSLPLLFVFVTSSSSITYAINTETVAGEIIRSLCGSIGLILTVPLTSIFAGYIIKKRYNPMSTRKHLNYKNRLK